MIALTLSNELFDEALGYMKTLEGRLVKKSKFSDEMLMSVSTMVLEKLFLTLLANNGIIGEHHTPLAMLNEAKAVIDIPESIEQTVTKLSKYESICSFDGFGYKVPEEDELKDMIRGLVELKEFVQASFKEELQEA